MGTDLVAGPSQDQPLCDLDVPLQAWCLILPQLGTASAFREEGGREGVAEQQFYPFHWGGRGLPRAPPVTSSQASWPCWVTRHLPSCKQGWEHRTRTGIRQAGQLCCGASCALWGVEQHHWPPPIGCPSCDNQQCFQTWFRRQNHLW